VPGILALRAEARHTLRMHSVGHGDTELRALAAGARTVLKDEPATLVERLGDGAAAVVRKTYRNHGLRLLQTFFRRSRAEREFCNLAAVRAAGVPCLEPLAWSALRTGPFVPASVLITRFLADSRPLKDVLGELPFSAVRRRRQLLAAMGRALRELHAAGLLWCTAMPRNFLLLGDAAAGRVCLADLPAAVRFRQPLTDRLARLDLYDAAFSPSRRRELSRGESLGLLRAYCAGDRARARALASALWRRSPLWQRLHKNLVMGVCTYILLPFSRAAR
jgi:hypothetical protein